MRLGQTALLVIAWSVAARSVAAEPVAFRKDVAPILQSKCLGCHSGPRSKGGLDLSSGEGLLAGGSDGAVVVPGKSADSSLIRLVSDKKMPPKSPLAPNAVAVLRQWVDEGAAWEGGTIASDKDAASKRANRDWWSLQPIRQSLVPRPADTEWANNPIDSFIKARLERANLALNPEADRRTLIRRVTLDLTGLWPAPEEVERFVANSEPDSYERLVDRLLTSPAYGERWARHWLDVVRFAESHGYEMNTLRPNAWPYRDWTIRAFNRDLPFDRFVLEQLAGDTIAGADELTTCATGYLVGGAHDLVGNQTEDGKRQQRSDDLFDMVSTTSTAFLGLTAGCARCHDHKFDPITQRDFYALEAVFAGVDHGERALRRGTSEEQRRELLAVRARLNELDRQLDVAEPEASPAANGMATRAPVNARRNVEHFARTEARFVRFTIEATNNGAQPCIDEIEIYSSAESETNLALASAGAKATASSELPNFTIHKIGHVNDGQFGNGRSWISNEAGRGWVQIELPKPAQIGRIIWGRDREEKFADRLPTRYRIEVSGDGKVWRAVAGSWDRGPSFKPSETVKSQFARRAELATRIATLEKPLTAYVGSFHTPDPTYLLNRGDVMQRGEVVTPRAIGGIGRSLNLSSASTDSERRIALADWISDGANPLPARVMVNRLWHHHFGRGLVRTPSDFGFNGDRPSHPELLDWLAAEFRTNGGRIKPLHRLIVLSKTYRQSSYIGSANAKADADNRLLSRFPSRRIEAEAVRDNIVRTAGALVRSSGGPGYDLWTYSNYVTVFAQKKLLGPDEFRRMVYQFKPRTQQDGTFGAFDCPDATGVVPRRQISTTALQALNLFNDEFMFDQADRFANQLRATKSDEAGQVSEGFRFAFQRQPSPIEAESALRLVRTVGLATFCRMLLNTNEFVTLE
jgi:Protein of unknown function (DUF1549)/Protein of unknown function (DUF1553)/Planctomycete cytochrome C